MQKYKRSEETTMSIYANKMDNLEEMDKFIKMYNLPKWNQKETEIMSDQSQVPKIKSLIKKTSIKQNSSARWLHR